MFNNNYNPYYNQQPRFQSLEQSNMQMSMPQYMQPQMQSNSIKGLLGKSVDSIDVVKAMDIPLDGSISYFPLTDGTAIVTKQLQTDGTSKTVIYKPVEDEKTVVKYITQEELEKSLKSIDLSELDDLKDEFKELRGELKDIQKKIKSKGD